MHRTCIKRHLHAELCRVPVVIIKDRSSICQDSCFSRIAVLTLPALWSRFRCCNSNPWQRPSEGGKLKQPQLPLSVSSKAQQCLRSACDYSSGLCCGCFLSKLHVKKKGGRKPLRTAAAPRSGYHMTAAPLRWCNNSERASLPLSRGGGCGPPHVTRESSFLKFVVYPWVYHILSLTGLSKKMSKMVNIILILGKYHKNKKKMEEQ